jgi:hypothetical protein
MLGTPHVPFRSGFGAKIRYASDQNASFYWDWGINNEAGGANDRFDLNRNNGNLFTITSAGSVGVGTTSPGFKLHVPSGYIGTDYINTTDNVVSSGVTGIMVKQGDNYHRTGDAASVRAFLGVTAPTGDNLGNHVATTTLNMAANTISNVGDILATNNYGTGLVGVYSDIRYQNVWAMGTSWRLAADGTTPGNLYGIAWTHSNIGGQSRPGLSHQMLVMENGVTKVALGSGIWTNYDVTGNRFMDQNDGAYYLDPNGTSELNQLTTSTRARWGRSRSWTNRSAYTGDQNYWTGTNGWATSEGTFADAWKFGFGGLDIWGSGTDHPQSGGGYVHAQGIVAGEHYASSDGSQAYGWMMVGAHNATENRYWLRGKWGGSTSGWVEMITTGNIGSQTVGTATNATNVPWSGVTSKPAGWLDGTNLIQDNGDFNNSMPSGFYQSSGAANAPGGSWYNMINVRHSNPGNDHGFQISMSYYDEYEYTRTYQGGSGANNGNYTPWARHLTNRPGDWDVSSNQTGSDYTQATLELREANYGGSGSTPPRLSFHWGGVVASQIKIEADGTIAVINNPGNAYEKFHCGMLRTAGITETSDRRLKKDIRPIDNAMSTVLQLNGVHYNWKTNEELDKENITMRNTEDTNPNGEIGFIAQEVEKIIPELVNTDKEGFKSMEYSKMVALLVEAYKDLHKEYESLNGKYEKQQQQLNTISQLVQMLQQQPDGGKGAASASSVVNK